MGTEVIWDGNHSLHNLTEEEKRNLPHSIHGICSCGAGFTLQPKIGVFDQNTAWYVCNACGYQISLFWQHEEERFKAVRSTLEALASGTSGNLDYYREKALRLLSHAQRTGVTHDPYFSREENEATVRKYMQVIEDTMYLQNLHTYLVVKHPNQYIRALESIEKVEDALAEIKFAVQELHQLGREA